MVDAVIFAGGIARGAFGAGALSVLLERVPDLDVRRVVATSSGALNGAYFARAIRSGVARTAGVELEKLWIEEGTASHAFDLSVQSLATLTAISNNARLLDLLRENVKPSTAKNPVELRMVVTSMEGDIVRENDWVATTFERVLRFTGETFDDCASLEPMFQAVTASAAFPVAYAPVEIDVDGHKVGCYDGGLVDNTPIGNALEDSDVTRIFVLNPYPAVFEAHPTDRHGIGLATHLADIVVSERLYRDMRAAREVNRALAALEAALDPKSFDAAVTALGWSRMRPVDIIDIRPPLALEGGAFSAVFSRDLREAYVRAGADAARNVLAKTG